jgi:hypothetical protein
MTAQDDRQAALDVSTAAGLALALRELLTASYHLLNDTSPAAARISGHLGCGLPDMAQVGETFALWEHANLQRGIDAYLAEYSPGAEWFAISGSRHHDDLASIISARGSQLMGPVLGTAATGPAAAMEVVETGMVPSAAPDGTPIVIAVTANDPYNDHCLRIEILAPRRAAAVAAREQIERLMRERDVLRGQVLSFGTSEHRGNELLSFLPRPELGADQVILPPGVLDSIERHVISITRHAEQLRAAGQHLKRGLLLHGFPGTGKTHTVRYLMSRMTGCTIILLTGHAMGYIESAAALARRLQPSLLVLEDVDLVAEDRDYSSDGNPLLFSLLDAMDGVGGDADVTFVLTTNRAEVLERALAERPGRVDLAVEIPRPDRQARARLLRLYAGGLRLDADLAPVLDATEGVTASFIRELLRRAVLAAIRESREPGVLTGADLTGAATELATERETLTRALLGRVPEPGSLG